MSSNQRLAVSNQLSALGCRLLFIFSSSYFLVSFAGCAGQVPPSGGPVDKTPPQIVYSSPSQKQLNFHSQKIVIDFDKYMVERTVENAIYFPPFSAKEIAFDWSGKELTVRLLTPLEKNRTYILTIGAGAQDDRGNNLGKAINLVFSTGANIDTGSVSGSVYFSQPQAFTVAAYAVTDSIDTLRPSMDLAKYVTQSDDSGKYVMQGLAAGKYRLICFDDQMKNFTYAPMMDNYASATHDITITDSVQAIDNINFMPAAEDTSRPQLYSADPAKDGTLLMKFSEGLNTTSISPQKFFVRDSVSAENFPVDFVVRREDNRYNVTAGLAKPLLPGHNYLVTALKGVRNEWGNEMSTENNTAAIRFDTATVNPQSIYFNFHDSLQDVTTYDTLFCQFISPIIFHSDSDSVVVSLIDSSGLIVPGGIVRRSTTIFGVSLYSLKSLEWYTFELKYYIADLKRDSLLARHFRMIDFSSLGDIEGNVDSLSDGMVSWSAGGKKIIVVAEGNGKKFAAMAGTNGKFSLDGIIAGTYTLKAYVQHDSSWSYFQGRSFPFKFAEPFGVYPDPVKVRARWTTEGAEIKLY